jgi:hypothetical protein
MRQMIAVIVVFALAAIGVTLGWVAGSYHWMRVVMVALQIGLGVFITLWAFDYIRPGGQDATKLPFGANEWRGIWKFIGLGFIIFGVLELIPW